jgi:hypothetical protein
MTPGFGLGAVIQLMPKGKDAAQDHRELLFERVLGEEERGHGQNEKQSRRAEEDAAHAEGGEQEESGEEGAHEAAERAEHADRARGGADVGVFERETVKPHRRRRDGTEQDSGNRKQQQRDHDRARDEPMGAQTDRKDRVKRRNEKGEHRGAGQQPAEEIERHLAIRQVTTEIAAGAEGDENDADQRCPGIDAVTKERREQAIGADLDDHHRRTGQEAGETEEKARAAGGGGAVSLRGG